MPCACIQVHHVVRLNTCSLNHPAGSMFEIDFQTVQTFFRFELNFQILKMYLRFQINSNGFSRDRSFGHYSKNNGQVVVSNKENYKLRLPRKVPVSLKRPFDGKSIEKSHRKTLCWC